MGIKFWDIATVDETLLAQVIQETNLPPLVCHILISRGYNSKEKINNAFFVSDELSSPYNLKDMDKAVSRIMLAVDASERIVVYGDYDCDGITATALLYSYLESIGANVTYYIPDRDKEGYGLNKEAIKKLHYDGTVLIITVDNGISALDEIDYANSLPVDVIVTDHHKPREKLPNALAVIDPHRIDCESGLINFSGVGVAFKLICALENDDGSEMLDYYSDFVCIGSIADVMALTGEVRTIVKHGLEKIADSERVGINSLIEISGMTGGIITAQSVAFGLVPRINAAGRVGRVESSLNLLTTDDYEYANELADEINGYNINRKDIELEIINDISKEIECNPHTLNQRIIVISGNNWHHGIIGIVCSKIVEKYGKPCILISVEGETARASGRSIEGFSLVDAVANSKDLLIRFGGHTLAAGFSIETKNIELFKNSIILYAKEKFSEMPNYSLKIDKALSISELTVSNIKSMNILEPFGSGNEYPLFAVKNLTIMEVSSIGNGKHLKLKLQKENNSFYAVYFGMTIQKFPYQKGDVVDIATSADINTYNGVESVSTKIKDIRLSILNQKKLHNGIKAYESYIREEELNFDKSLIIPTREDIAYVYKYLKKCGEFHYDYDILYSRIATKELNYCKIRVVVDILLELGLIKISKTNDGKVILINQSSEKVDISTSKILSNLQK